MSWLSVAGSSVETLDEPTSISFFQAQNPKKGRQRKGDAREESGPAVGGGPVLEVHAEVVAADEGFEAGARPGAAVVLAELDRLVDGTVAVAQVCGEGVAEVDAEAFRRAKPIGEDHHRLDRHTMHAECERADAQSDGSGIVDQAILIEDGRGAEPRDNDLQVKEGAY